MNRKMLFQKSFQNSNNFLNFLNYWDDSGVVRHLDLGTLTSRRVRMVEHALLNST